LKHILITGASKGIGRAIAIRLAAKNIHIFVHGRDKKALDETIRLIEKSGGSATEIIADLSTIDGCEKLVSAVGKKSINVLIHNAGVAYVKPFDKLNLEEWNRTVAINITAPFLITQRLVPKMKKGSSIINILSIAAKSAFSSWSSYCMSKHALRGFSESLREELRPRGIRVINVYPAAVATDIWEGVAGNWPKEKMLSPDEVAEAVAFALSRPKDVMVDDVTIENVGGRL